MHIVPFYAALLALLFVALSVRTLRLRRHLQIAVGDSGNHAMLRAMRVHSNFAEYVPLSLLLLYFAELRGAHALFLHLLAVGLLAGRCAHAYGVSQLKEDYRYRVFGMAMTLGALVLTAAYLLYSYLPA
jgi:uncharacterized membrane protein YecN with MAPEG domain